jgi:hypothetical protein
LRISPHAYILSLKLDPLAVDKKYIVAAMTAAPFWDKLAL